jgi:soluble lytic murein transglycosylase-like protein
LAGAALANLGHRFPHDYYTYQAHAGLAGRLPSDVSSSEGVSRPTRSTRQITGLVAAGLKELAHQALTGWIAKADVVDPPTLRLLVETSTANGDPRLSEVFQRHLDWRFGGDTAAYDRIRVEFPESLTRIISHAAGHENVPPELAIAMAHQANRFQPMAAGANSAAGIFQLNTHAGLLLINEESRRRSDKVDTLREVNTNIRLAMRYFGRIYRTFGGRAEYALAAWNAGPGAVTRWRQGRGDFPGDIFVEEIPYTATRDYVRRVLATAQVYRLLAVGPAQRRNALAANDPPASGNAHPDPR